MTKRIKGIAYRPHADPARPLHLTVPDEVPVTVEFDTQRRIGYAKLRQEENGDVHAEVDVPDSLMPPTSTKYFSIGTAKRDYEVDPRITHLAAVQYNIDAGLPPYTVEDA